jgi:succinate-semialdehyde dehydrogenase / glutarate-semialdehyde dehydrogenase
MCMRFFAERAEGFLAEEEVASAASRSLIRYEPLGPVLAVMPWNFPLWQVVRFAAPALMAGNVGLLKHASNVPQAALFLEDAFRRAGFPDGAFTTLLVPAGAVAGIIADDRIAAVTLTGSEGAGRSVAAAAGQALKKCVLELGGSDPFLVLSSADIERAVQTAVTARVQNNGQSCIAAKRFVVVDDVADRFVPAFVDAMAALTVGDPFDPATDVGPLVSAAQRAEIAAQVDDARDKGAVVACGGEILPGDGWFYAPTVLTGVTPSMRAYGEEIFGPVAVVEQVADIDEAIGVANRTTFGLGASVWATDPEEQQRCVEGIEAGMVYVNAMVASTPELPFGGIKRSGYGRELSELGIKEFCNAKAVWLT